MPLRHAVALPLLVLLALGALPGCSEKRKKQTGPLKDWVVGNWVRMDDLIVWSFKADGEMITGGALPIAGSYRTEDPDKVVVTVSGANALTTSMQLGVPVDPVNHNLTLTLILKDDEMRPAVGKSDVVFRKE